MVNISLPMINYTLNVIDFKLDDYEPVIPEQKDQIPSEEQKEADIKNDGEIENEKIQNFNFDENQEQSKGINISSITI